jgi:multiple sugar transport system substrate-binding protein
MQRTLIRILSAGALLLAACGPSGQSGPPASAPAGGASQPTAAPAAGQATTAPATGGASGSVTFFSNQFKPVEEQGKMQDIILKDAPVKVDYIPEDPGPFNDRITAEQKANKVTVSLIGGLHGDLESFVKAGYLEDLTPLQQKLADRGFPDQFTQLAHYGQADKTYYIPWMQATYVLAINKKALEYKPQGVDENALTYQQLKDWGAAIQKATNKRMLGFPAGPKGLMHRFFQGYLYPSYTGSAGVVAFKTPEAATMWQDFKDIWQYVNPQSTNYEYMQEPLASEEVWIAWDHVARLINVANDRPNDFILVPAPAGPKGRGFMPVLAGMAIPKGAPNRAGAEAVIDYLTQAKQQSAVAANLAFFPVTSAPVPQDVKPGIKLESDAVQKQSSSKDALVSLLPIGLGAKSGDFNNVYLETFQRIVLKNEPIQQVLDDRGKVLQGIMDESKAGCWAPDPPSNGPCQVK